MALGSDALALAAGLGVALAVLLIGFALAGDDGTSRQMRRRLGRVMPVRSGEEPGASLRRDSSDSGIAVLDRLLKRILPQPQKLRLRLAKTGRSVSLGEYVLVNLVLTAVVGLGFWLGFGFRWPIALLLGTVAGLGLPHLAVGYIGARRIGRFLDAFPDAIDLICRGLRSGLPVTESITTVGKELPDPIGIEFRRISDNVRMGASLDDAMWEVARRLDAPEFRFLIIAMAIQRETGGNLAETLGNLADLLRKRRALKLKIRAMSSEARASAWIIGSLPFLMFGILFMLNRRYVMMLFHDPRGLMMTGVSLFFIALGVLIMARMVRFRI